MRFEVPQFIEVEDKIFGPLTWRQFVYVGGGLAMSFITVFILPSVLPRFVSWLVILFVGLPLGLLALALAFYPVNNRPFSYFLEAAWNYAASARLYLWRQRADVVYKTAPKPKDAAPVAPVNRGTKHKSITSLTRSLELQALQKPES